MNRIFKIDARVKVKESSNNNEQVYAEVFMCIVISFGCIMRFIN